MDSTEIYNVLALHPATRLHYIGTFPLDKLPKCLLPRPSICVANTDPAGEPGEHWVGFYFSDDVGKSVDFFDSYGLSPQKDEFFKFMDRNSDVCVFNNKQLQDFQSSSCGKFVCLFLLYRCLGFSMSTFQNMFSHNLKTNEKLVQEMYEFHFFASMSRKNLLYVPPADFGYPCSHVQKGGRG